MAYGGNLGYYECLSQYKNSHPNYHTEYITSHCTGHFSYCTILRIFLFLSKTCGTVQYSTALFSTVQHCSVQYSSIQYSTALFSCRPALWEAVPPASVRIWARLRLLPTRPNERVKLVGLKSQRKRGSFSQSPSSPCPLRSPPSSTPPPPRDDRPLPR